VAIDGEMRLRGRIGGYSKAAKYPPKQLTGAARAAFLKGFEPEDPSLSEEERQRRAKAALRAHMAKLSWLSVLARRKGD
jgi:tRNA U34 5-methylaminomethyl-2-thiouridine-forming methyltransferase MnmC